MFYSFDTAFINIFCMTPAIDWKKETSKNILHLLLDTLSFSHHHGQIFLQCHMLNVIFINIKKNISYSNKTIQAVNQICIVYKSYIKP